MCIKHTEQWSTQQFGEEYAAKIAGIINTYAKYNRRVTPEMLNSTTYSLENYNEFQNVVNDYRALALDALRLYNQIPNNYKDAYYQLVLYPVNACCNLYEMYYAVAKNKQLATENDTMANYYADKVKECFERDILLQDEYSKVIAGGKWAHMMDQIRIGYSTWHEPKNNIMPEVVYVEPNNMPVEKVFLEDDGYVSIDAENYSKSGNTKKIHWEILPYFGKTKSGVTTFPANEIPADTDEVYLEYDIDFKSQGEFEVQLLLAPTLNYNDNKGLRYEISFDGNAPQTVNFNGAYRGELGKWQADPIIKSVTKHTVSVPGRHVMHFKVLNPGIVLEKILIDTGGLKPSYLGAPQSKIK